MIGAIVLIIGLFTFDVSYASTILECIFFMFSLILSSQILVLIAPMFVVYVDFGSKIDCLICLGEFECCVNEFNGCCRSRAFCLS